MRNSSAITRMMPNRKLREQVAKALLNKGVMHWDNSERPGEESEVYEKLIRDYQDEGKREIRGRSRRQGATQ